MAVYEAFKQKNGRIMAVNSGKSGSAMIAIYEFNNTGPITDLFEFSYLRTCTAYDATALAIGFDEIRVRYRTPRRAILREIILRSLVGKSMTDYIESEINKLIPENDLIAFREDLKEDLEQLDENRIAGLGVTLEQLKRWRRVL